MQCTEVQKKLADYSVGLLSERERSAIAAHLAECSSCAREWRALERVDRVLSALPPEEPPAHLWMNIRAQIEASPQVAPLTPFWRRWFTVPRLAMGSAAAAAVLLTVAYLSQLHAPEAELPPSPQASDLMHAHQMMSWGDPLSDRAALGAVLASRPQWQEVP